MIEFGGRRPVAVFLALSSFLVFYLFPVLTEYALLRLHFSAFLCCVVLSDLPGVTVLYAMGFKRSAIAIYAAAAVLETLLFVNGMIPTRLIWLTNLGPAFATAAAVFVLLDFEPD
jgi:hypothetical protein